MLKPFLLKAAKNPVRLFALVLVAYMALHSVAVWFILGVVGWAFIQHRAKHAHHMKRDHVDRDPEPQEVTESVAADPVAEPTPIRKKYAKSAVVVDIKTGTED